MGAIRTVTAEDEGLAAAIAETEQEIFTEANGDDPPENTGDKSLEEQGNDLEGRTSESDDDQEEETDLEGRDSEDDPEDEEGEAEAEEAPTQRTEGREALVPSGRLRETTARARAAETEAATLREQMAELRGRLDQFTRTQPQNQQQAKQPEVPDMFSDPEGWQNHIKGQLAAEFETKRVDASLADAAEAHGAKFTEAYNNLQALGRAEMSQNGGRSPTVARIWNAPNPGKALLSWHQQQAALKEIGGDLNGYKDKLKDELLNDPEFVASVIQHARGEATNGRRANRTIPSLNGASGRRHTDADPNLYDNSEGSVFDFATAR